MNWNRFGQRILGAFIGNLINCFLFGITLSVALFISQIMVYTILLLFDRD